MKGKKILMETLVTIKVSIVLCPEFNMEAKDRILQKAHELFMRYGIRSVSMDDMSAQLGMSKKTLYQYYSDKEELIDAVVTALLVNNQKKCMEGKQNAENAIHEVFQAFEMIQELFENMNPSIVFDLDKYHASVYKKIHQHKHVFMYDVIRQNIQRGIKEELYRPEIDVDIITRFRIESMMLAFNSEVFPTNRTHLVKIQHEILEHFLFGLATPKGHKIIQKYKSQRNK
jgi:AcrR family transcriptional regulator